MSETDLSVLSAAERALLRPGGHPDWVEPMLATLTDRRPDDSGWLFERKLDGIRCIAFRHGHQVRLLSRNKQRLDGAYPELVDALLSQPNADFVVDGEVVAFEGTRTSFARLQQRSGISDPEKARRSGVPVSYYLFDIVRLDGHDLRVLPLRSRKRLLRRGLVFSPPLRFTTHRVGDGKALLAAACEKGWEGLVAKRADSVYASRRSNNWLKLKCEAGQELVIGGFTEPAGSRFGFGAVLVGYYEDGELVYAGKVGTGFDDRTLRELRSRFEEIETGAQPFAGSRRFERGTHFVEPVLVAQVGFSEWTRDGMLRHPRFLELRTDKDPLEVTRETPTGEAKG